MKAPRFIKIQFPENKTFDVVKVTRPYFVVPWHFHPEIEIMLIIQGSGTRFVGDSIERFDDSDLVMLGPNLAHVWKNDDSHFHGNRNRLAEAIYIVFTVDSFGGKFFELAELASIRELVQAADKGLKFGADTRKKIEPLFLEAETSRGIDQFFLFVKILNTLAEATDVNVLCSPRWRPKLDASDLHRLDSVLDYLLINFRNDVKLEDVANIANMSVNAFCRYFKDRTNKTVIQFLNEIRIEHAHRLLAGTDYNVDQISAESGFRNVSNFYQQFQKITGVSPLKYRKENKPDLF